MTKIINVESYSLTALQQGMLYHTLSDPNSGVDIEQILWRIREPLDVPVLQRAWTHVVRRHPILRTRFQWEGISEPRQLVKPDVDLPWKCHDWRHQSSTESKKRLEKFLFADRRRDFEMTEPPLMRLNLFELSNTDYQFLWTFHHALLDGRSFPLVINEVFQYYEAFIENRDLAIEEPRPYRDYVQWLQQQDLSRAEKFWRQHLKGFSAPTPLTVAHSVDENGEKGRDAEETRLSDKLTTKLNSLAGDHELTLNTLIQGAWALLLHHYSGEDDIVFGATRACRHSTVDGAESMIGLLINTLPVRVCISPDQPLLDWLKQIRKQQLVLRPYENTALSDVQRWSDVLSQAPLFESVVVFDDASLNARLRAQGGRWLKREFIYRGQTNYALTLIGYGDSQLSLRIEYDRQRFDRPSARRMLGHVSTLLEGMTANPNVAATRVPYVTSAERQQLLLEYSVPRMEGIGQLPVHMRFEQQVAQRPDAVAVYFEDRQLTYRELNTRANQLAHHLQALGVGPETLVGLCLERSAEMVIGILAVLKAGGAYLPLDPQYPTERLAFIVEDARPALLLTQSRMHDHLPDQGVQVLCLDDPEMRSTLQKRADDNPASQVEANNLAYVIYTSGSTGKPKGVLITHANVARLFGSTERWFQFGPDDVWTLFHSYAFDFSVWEIWGALLYGGQLVVVPYQVSRSPETFYRLLVERGVTVLNQTPSAFQQLVKAEEQVGPDPDLALRWVIFGGEALELHTLKPWIQRHGDAQPKLINMYGITETTVHVTFRSITADDVTCRRGSVIGVPIPDLQVYVLDGHLEPVPIGVPGEIYVGGAGLARGYLNRPELNQQRFITHPFGRLAGDRLYKTGDIGRFSNNRELEYLGRGDRQVQLRGFRIELGEIEAVVAEHALVRQVVVIVREDDPGDRRLVAYVVPTSTHDGWATQLRALAETQLPAYMVPQRFIVLDSLPVTNNGKIDRHALPPPSQERSTERLYVAPRDQTERTIARIWREVLKVSEVGIHDSFFEVGGHSLLLVTVLGKLQTSFDRALSVVELFRYPTVAKLATYLAEKQEKKASFATTHDLVRKQRTALSQYKKVTLAPRKST